MAKVLTRAGAMVQAPGMIYKAVVKTVLHYVSEICVLIGAMIKVLEKCFHQVSIQMAVNTYR